MISTDAFSYINVLRGILKKLNLKETYNFEKWRK